jgi:hypothetical protein
MLCSGRRVRKGLRERKKKKKKKKKQVAINEYKLDV